MRDYIYVDKNRLRMYLEQIPGIMDEVRRTHSFGASLTGPSFKVDSTRATRNLGVHESIEAVIAHLREEDLLDSHRPINEQDAWSYSAKAQHQTFALRPGVPVELELREPRPFVLETMTATKVSFRSKALENIGTPGPIAVWVSDPPAEQIQPYPNEGPFDIKGTFLYLIESYFDDGSYGAMISGHSALSELAKTLVLSSPDGFEPLGRGNNDHPLTKLERLGGVVHEPRHITSLYRKRYISNEQNFVYDGCPVRVCDLTGYAIFVQAHDMA